MAALERVGSEDAHGRAVLALGRAMASAPDRTFRASAAGVFRRALPGTVALTALRARERHRIRELEAIDIVPVDAGKR